MISTVWSKLAFIVATLALASPLGWAQTASKTGPQYNVASEVKVKGVIEDIRQVPGAAQATQLAVKTDEKTILVYVGPEDFLKEIEVSFTKGDKVDIVGAKAPNGTEEEILAREITVGSNTFTLRDDKGVPIWSGWKPMKVSGK
ncbi:MAG: hypothetical protein WCC87_24735 [Candidatus Korobacteraceae bacterium]